MAAVIETHLICDADRCGATFGVDNRSWPARTHRKHAAENGWIRSGGKDFCPNCRFKAKNKKSKNT